MPKKPSKSSGNPEYSPEHRFNVLLTDVQEKVGSLTILCERMQGNLKLMQIAFPAMPSKDDLRRAEAAIREEIKKIAGALEKRDATLEAR